MIKVFAIVLITFVSTIASVLIFFVNQASKRLTQAKDIAVSILETVGNGAQKLIRFIINTFLVLANTMRRVFAFILRQVVDMMSVAAKLLVNILRGAIKLLQFLIPKIIKALEF